MRAKISLQRETSKTSLLEWTLNLCDCKIWRVTHNEPTINGLSPHIFIDLQNAKECYAKACELCYRDAEHPLYPVKELHEATPSARNRYGSLLG